MKKVTSVIALFSFICMMMLGMSLQIQAADNDIVIECEDGELSGNASIDSQLAWHGNTVVGLSGSGANTTASTVSFKNIDIPKYGCYKFILSYDICNDATRKVDLLVDDVRYNFKLPALEDQPSAWRLNLYTVELIVPVKAGKHTFALTSSLDFNRDSSSGVPVVKSVNVNSLTIQYVNDDILLECSRGILSGAASIDKQPGFDGSTMVSLSGSDDDKTKGSTVTFKDVEVYKDANYKFVLAYDTSNDTTKKVDLLVDDVRYNFPLPAKADLPAEWRKGIYEVSVIVPVKKGIHTFAVTTSLDFNRDKTDPDKYIKSVNAKSLTLKYDSEIVVPPTSESEISKPISNNGTQNTSKKPSSTVKNPPTRESFPAATIMIVLMSVGATAVILGKSKMGKSSL